MVHLKAIRQTYLKSCGSFSYAKCAYSTSCSDDLFDVLEEKTEENIGYDQWVANTKASLKNSKGRFWLGKSTVMNHYLNFNFTYYFSHFLIILFLYLSLYFLIHQNPKFSNSLKKIQLHMITGT